MNLSQVKVFISAPFHDSEKSVCVTATYNGSYYYMIPYRAYKKAWDKLCGHPECGHFLKFVALDKRLCTVAGNREWVTFHASELLDNV